MHDKNKSVLILFIWIGNKVKGVISNQNYQYCHAFYQKHVYKCHNKIATVFVWLISFTFFHFKR